jgi:DNA replication protein DnaC
MGIENFIKDAHYKPNDYVAYHVGWELAELHPDKIILEGNSGYFDLDAFVRAKQCSIVAESSVFNHIRTRWRGPRKDPRQDLENSWLNVFWQGQLLDVVLITWAEGCYRSRHQWIVAENRKLAEAFFAAVCEWSAEVRGEILVFSDGDWEKNEELYDAIKSATFANLILPDTLKQQVQTDFDQFFRARDVYEQYGIPWKRGALFIGPPGNGKTHTVKALINQLGQPCLYVKGFKSEYATEQENMGAVFARARMTTPCMLVLEDLDSMIDDENRSFFLNELDGFENNTGLVVLATTNHADRLDPAILNRPSRFDRKYYFNLPGVEERRAYVMAWNRSADGNECVTNSDEIGCEVKTGSDSVRGAIDTVRHSALRLSEEAIEEVVHQTENFSFAYLKELFLSATMQWISTRAVALDSEHRPTPAGEFSMDEIIREQAALLRNQMTAASDSASPSGKLGRALSSVRRLLRS